MQTLKNTTGRFEIFEILIFLIIENNSIKISNSEIVSLQVKFYFFILSILYIERWKTKSFNEICFAIKESTWKLDFYKKYWRFRWTN